MNHIQTKLLSQLCLHLFYAPRKCRKIRIAFFDNICGPTVAFEVSVPHMDSNKLASLIQHCQKIRRRTHWWKLIWSNIKYSRSMLLSQLLHMISKPQVFPHSPPRRRPGTKPFKRIRPGSDIIQGINAREMPIWGFLLTLGRRFQQRESLVSEHWLHRIYKRREIPKVGVSLI